MILFRSLHANYKHNAVCLTEPRLIATLQFATFEDSVNALPNPKNYNVVCSRAEGAFRVNACHVVT